MSISIDILPTKEQVPTWANLKQEIKLFASAEALLLLGEEPQILNLKSKVKLEDAEIFKSPSYFYFSLSRENTLNLSYENNAENYTEVNDYVEDYGRNLTRNQISYVMNEWSKSASSFTLESFGGRAQGESSLFMAITIAISKLTNGFIVIQSNDVFSLPVGIYTLEEFRSAKPLFGRQFLNV
jgi:hypothetical protein